MIDTTRPPRYRQPRQQPLQLANTSSTPTSPTTDECAGSTKATTPSARHSPTACSSASPWAIRSGSTRSGRGPGRTCNGPTGCSPGIGKTARSSTTNPPPTQTCSRPTPSRPPADVSNDPSSDRDATELAAAVLAHESLTTATGPVLLSPWAKPTRTVNPSYLAPFVFDALAESDRRHDLGDRGSDRPRPPHHTDHATDRPRPGLGNAAQRRRRSHPRTLTDRPPTRDRTRRLAHVGLPRRRLRLPRPSPRRPGVDVPAPPRSARRRLPPRRRTGRHLVTPGRPGRRSSHSTRRRRRRRHRTPAHRGPDLDRRHPSYYGSAWLALGSLLLNTDLLGGCATDNSPRPDTRGHLAIDLDPSRRDVTATRTCCERRMDLKERLAGTERRHPWEIARARSYRKLIAAHTDLAAVRSVLDIGAGDGWFASDIRGDLAEPATIACWDINYRSEDLATPIGPGISRTRDRPAGPFDVVFALDVLEHIACDEAFVADVIVPSIAPRGVGLLSVPAHPRLFSDHDRMLEHERRYRPAAFRALVGPPPRRRRRRLSVQLAGPATRPRPSPPEHRPRRRADGDRVVVVGSPRHSGRHHAPRGRRRRRALRSTRRRAVARPVDVGRGAAPMTDAPTSNPATSTRSSGSRPTDRARRPIMRRLLPASSTPGRVTTRRSSFAPAATRLGDSRRTSPPANHWNDEAAGLDDADLIDPPAAMARGADLTRVPGPGHEGADRCPHRRGRHARRHHRHVAASTEPVRPREREIHRRHSAVTKLERRDEQATPHA